MVETRAKRQRTARQTNLSRAEAKHAPNLTSPLLSLPSELRFMIWEAVVADPILLYGTNSTRRAPVQITAIRSVALDLDYLKHSCNKNPQSSTSGEQCKKVGPLSWLRTNRQIYAEAQPLVNANLSLHICDPMVLVALLKRTSNLQPSTLRSLSLCLRVKMKYGHRNGVVFALGADHGGHPWARHPACCCWWCCATRKLPQDGKAMDLRFPALKEIRLRVHFSSNGNEGNDRPVSQRTRAKPLGRPENPSPLQWRGEEGDVQSLVDQISAQLPLRMLNGGRKKRVEVRFAVNSIEHNPSRGIPIPPTGVGVNPSV